MAWRTQEEIKRDRERDRRNRERLDIQSNSAYWDGPGGSDCDEGCDEDDR
jgi:hypothetical protein